jgi:hypothetical protein
MINPATEIIDRIGHPVTLVPIPKGEKGPKLAGWQKLTVKDMTPAYLSQFNTNMNIGVVLGSASSGLVSIDADTDEGFKEFMALNPSLSATQVTKGSRGGNFWFNAVGTYPKSAKIKCSNGSAWGEFRADGNQTVIYGQHPTGVQYWNNGNAPLSLPLSAINFPKGLILPWEQPAKEEQPVLPAKRETYSQDRSSLITRAQAYVDKMPPAIEGQCGNDATFAVAKKLVHDFDLSFNEALPIMCDYNARCSPPWEMKDLARKLEDAAKCSRSTIGRGELAVTNRKEFSNSAYGLAKQSQEEKKAALYDAFQLSTIPCTKLKNIGIPPRRKIVGDWFCESDLGFVFAPRGLGKTWFALGLAVSIVAKETFGPWKIHDHPSVLYVDGEMPCESLETRIAGLGGDDSLHVLNHEGLFHKANGVLNLTDPDAQDAITKVCLEKGIQVIVLDNLSCLFSGIKENDNDAWEAVLPWLLSLRRHRISVLIVAHSGRSGQNMRGASRREDAAFFIVRLDDVPEAGCQQKEGASFVSRFTKNRNSKVEEVPIQWTFLSDEYGNIHILHKEADGLSVLIDWVATGLDSASDIAEEMGISKGQVSKMANRAINAGLLVKDGRKYALPS